MCGRFAASADAEAGLISLFAAGSEQDHPQNDRQRPFAHQMKPPMTWRFLCGESEGGQGRDSSRRVGEVQVGHGDLYPLQVGQGTRFTPPRIHESPSCAFQLSTTATPLL